MRSPAQQNARGSGPQHQPQGRRNERREPLLWQCSYCDTMMLSGAKAQHTCPAAIESTALPNETPLDRFFLSYPSFLYDRSLSPAESYRLLSRHQRWRRGDPRSDDGWNRYQNALKEEFQLWFGTEDDLGAWHALCRAVGLVPLPSTCGQCKKAVRKRHVNLVDLIEWGRNGGESEGKKVRIFPSVEKLRQYCQETGKIFRNDLDEDSEEGGVVLRHLLRRLFSTRPTSRT